MTPLLYVYAAIINSVIALFFMWLYPNFYGVSATAYFVYTFLIFCVFDWFVILIVNCTENTESHDIKR